ncbi:MAG TPA: replication factor C large subunit [Candidatus Woesearchaeota archaeon]|nr:replication factor C large subunit [Candidatus Woesearchaeota archaeon]
MESGESFVVKYLPSTVKEVVGQDLAINSALRELESFKKGKKTIMLYGPSGSGKTSFVYAFGKEYNYDIVELNASDMRNKDALTKMVCSVMNQGSLFFKKRLLLIDEIDGISGTKDRGAIPYLASIVGKSSIPVIIVGNDIFSQKLSTLRKKCVLIEFQRLDYTDIKKILKGICEKEAIDYEDDALSYLARQANGDVRAAVNDLQIASAMNEKLNLNIIQSISTRNSQEDLSTALVKVFKTTNFDIAKGAFDFVSENYDEILLWLEENIPTEYKKLKDLYRAYDALSRANIFSSRIIKRQHWRFLVYVFAELSVGIALSKDEKYVGFNSYVRSSRILKMWIYKQKRAKSKEISWDVSKRVHCSSKEALYDFLPYLSAVLSSQTPKGNYMKKELIKELELDTEQIETLLKIGKAK